MSRLHPFRGLTALVAFFCLVGCETAKSAHPTAPSVAGPIAGVSIGAPRPLEPFAGSTLTYTGEPLTLLIENASTSGERTLWLQLEVGTDSQFQQIVHQADRIELGSNGRTAYRLPSPLQAGATYYWRTRAFDGANSGPFSAVSSFAVVAPVVINPPVATAPAGKLTSNKPDFKVTNGAFSGTNGVVYRFEVAQSADFNQMAAVVTVQASSTGTTTMSLGELPWKTTYFWRVVGSDGAKESGYSNVMSFTTPDPPPPPKPPTPAPTAPDAPVGPVDSSLWTGAQWKKYFFSLVEARGCGTVSNDCMRAIKRDLNAKGAEFQNGWRGDLRPRIFLPVIGCPLAMVPDVPQCSYNRTVDLGSYGGPWQWIERF